MVSGYEETSEKALNEAKKVPIETGRDRGRLIGANPILAHRMTDRYSFEVDALRKLMNSTQYFIVRKNYIRKLGLEEDEERKYEKINYFQVNWPNHYDLLVSLVANLEIQSFYDLKPETVIRKFIVYLQRFMKFIAFKLKYFTKVTRGATFDSNFGGILDSSDNTLLSMMGLRLGYYYLTLDWLEFTKGWGLGILNYDKVDLVKSLYQVAIQLHNNKYKSDKTSESSELHLLVDPIKVGSAFPRIPFRKHAIQLYGRKYGNYTLAYLNMYSICKGDEFQPKSIKHQLHCFLEKRRHPYFILNHLKTEELSKYPYIVQFYEVLGNKTIDEVYKSRTGPPRLTTAYGYAYLDSVAHRSCSGSLLDYELDIRIYKHS